MRVLLDEDLPIRLRHYFGEGVEAVTVEKGSLVRVKKRACLLPFTAARAGGCSP